jgi:hypothetical protein
MANLQIVVRIADDNLEIGHLKLLITGLPAGSSRYGAEGV